MRRFRFGDVVQTLAFVVAMVLLVVVVHTVTASNHDLKERSVRLQDRIDTQATQIDGLVAAVQTALQAAATANSALVEHAVLCLENHAANRRGEVPLDPTCPAG